MEIASAWVTDLTTIHNFYLSDKELEKVADDLGIPIEQDEYLYTVAQRLKDNEESGS